MKAEFASYYPPTDAESETLWKEGLVVLDANVLLDLYRLPATARDELLAVLQSLAKRLWLPYHVAMEFQRRRHTVVALEARTTEDSVKSILEDLAEVQQRVQQLELAKRNVDVDVEALDKVLKAAASATTDALEKVKASQVDISSKDQLRDAISELFSGKIGPPPKDQGELDAIFAEGSTRFEKKIPPGFMDAEKDKNPHEASFIHHGLSYVRKYGDLVLWKQMLAYVAREKIGAVMFITGDKKSDWWWREQGKTFGPHTELSNEIRTAAGVNLFWMYSADQFFQRSQQYVGPAVSEQSVNELRDVQIASAGSYVNLTSDGSFLTGAIRMRRPERDVERLIFGFLVDRFGADRVTRSVDQFPDFIVDADGRRTGFETVYGQRLVSGLLQTRLTQKIMEGHILLSRGRLQGLVVFVAIEEWDEEMLRRFQRRIDQTLSKYPITEVIVGTVLGGKFDPIVSLKPEIGDENERDWSTGAVV